MILDFITRTNNMNYNIKLAKLFGIYSSVFLSILLDCHFLNPQEEFIKLSRDDLYNLSGMDEEKQKDVEDNLVGYGLIEIANVKNSNSKFYYKLNIEFLTKILTSEDKNIENELQQTFKTFKKATKPPASVSKRQAIINNLKANIKNTDTIVRTNLEDWIDAVMQKSGYLSKAAVEYMEKELIAYSKGKITLLRELCNAAARLVYKDPKWVITNFEQNNTKDNLKLNEVSQQEVDDNIQKLKQYNGETF